MMMGEGEMMMGEEDMVDLHGLFVGCSASCGHSYTGVGWLL